MTVTSTDPHDTPAGPYATAAMTYFAHGWSPLPLPAGQKAPVPEGWTGARGATPSGADVHEWTEQRGAGNIALRLPPNVIGVDCDNYDAKPGGLVLAELEKTLGALPPTWRATSRDDGISGIRLYRIPEGLRWPGGMGPGIDTIRHDHRYAVVWPSTHPKGGTYRWYTPDGLATLTGIPTPDELPDLPDTWVQHFTGGELATDQPHAGLDRHGASTWLNQHGTGGMCRLTEKALAAGLAQFATTPEGSRYGVALSLTNRLAWVASGGHTGVTHALEQARKAYLAAIGDLRDAASEFDRMTAGAIDIAAANGSDPNQPDPCKDPFHGLIDRSTTWETTRTDQTSPRTPSTQPPCPTSATPSASSSTPSTTASTSPTPGSTASASTSASTATTGPADGGTAHRGSTSPSDDSPTVPDSSAEPALDPEQQQLYYLQELARISARQDAQRHFDEAYTDRVIADRVRRRLLDDKAALEYKRRTEPPAPPFDAGTLADILARPDEPPMRVDGLIPWAGSALVVAMRKTGKTTLLLNYARALITGEPFLGEFDVIPMPPEARVAFLNYEVSAAQLARWAHDAGIPDDRLYLVNLRGRRNPLGHPDDRAALAAQLRDQNVQAVIVDPFGRAYTGVSQNDNGEVQAFLVGLEEFVRTDVGALDLLLAAHAGWDGERTRGASALEDWGDTIITLTRDSDDETKRYMKAMGRDVDVDEDELRLEDHRTLIRTGNGSRKNQRDTRKTADLAVYVARVVDRLPRDGKIPSKKSLANLLLGLEDYSGPRNLSNTAGSAALSKAIEAAERAGRVHVDRGPKGASWILSRTDTTNPQPTQGVGTDTSHTPPIGGVGGGAGGGDRSRKTITRVIEGTAYVFDAVTKELLEEREVNDR